MNYLLQIIVSLITPTITGADTRDRTGHLHITND
jgi:hypothetical protein